MKVTIVGVVIALLGVVVLILAPRVRRSLIRNHNGYRGADNYVIGALIVLGGILIAAHVFSH